MEGTVQGYNKKCKAEVANLAVTSSVNWSGYVA